MSGIDILQVKGVYAHYHYKPRNPDERSWVMVTWTRAQPGGLKHIVNWEIATPVDIKHHVIESAEFATSEIPMGSEPLDQTLI
jgi:hypothetical protein